MRIVVFSDSHGRFDALFLAVESQPEAEVFLHLGDGEYEADDLRALFPAKWILFVRGNCDRYSGTKTENLITVAGKRIFFTHGHIYGVKDGAARLIARANDLGADIVCFGHTHSPLSERAGQLYLLNPGSIDSSRSGGSPSYATIDIADKDITINFARL